MFFPVDVWEVKNHERRKKSTYTANQFFKRDLIGIFNCKIVEEADPIKNGSAFAISRF